MNVEKTYFLPFPTTRVYAAWVSSDTVIAPATRMDINPVVGGHYRLLIESPEYVGKNQGRFLIVEEERHVRYTWEWNDDGEVSEIDVTFASVDKGTEIVVSHSGFQKPESVASHSSEWDSYIAGLKVFLE